MQFAFGPYKIAAFEVFRTSPLSFAFVNLRPLVPGLPSNAFFVKNVSGHVLISPKRVVARYRDLSKEEISDLWQLTQEVGDRIEKHFKAESLSLCIQDGPAAGQTVEHVHVHCIPRKRLDFVPNEEIYTQLEQTPTNRQRSLNGSVHSKETVLFSSPLNLDVERKDRTPEEMSKEAEALRALFHQE